MIRLPSKNIGISVNSHNNDLMVLSDWVETSCLLRSITISKSALEDLLVGEHIYQSPDLCSARIEDLWSEIQRRQTLLHRARFLNVGSRSISPKRGWVEQPGTTFCLVVALSHRFEDWQRNFGRNYTVQGELFERICEESLVRQLPGCQVKRTGWSRTRTNNLAKVVRDLAKFIGDDEGNLTKWAPRKGKEAGVDLAWHLPMRDGLAGPRYFGQCASGADWMRKRSEPDLETWAKYIDFVNVPLRAVFVPVALDRDDFVRMSPMVHGILLERYRILGSAKSERDWISNGLSAELVDWLLPKVDWLLQGDLLLDSQ